ncbi:MAG: peptidoglycan-binding domain-containing protein [Candidatus Nomurabacteria bacterium]
MKKIFIISLTILSFQFAYAGTCFDLPKNINRWENSPSVTSLQNFLVSKGLLKATPNGYFGNGTFLAVKAYQKSIGVQQTGTVGVSTRASIKKETCNSNSSIAPVVQNNIKTNIVIATSTIKTTANSTLIATSSINKATTTVVYKTPTVSRFSSVTFFVGGSRDWDVYLYGTNFSTSTTNSIYFKSKNSGRKYLIGEVKSLNGTDIILPRDFMTKLLPCGSDCSEAISIGGYDISVVSNGLESNTIYTIVNGFTATVVTGTENQALVSKVTNALFGRLTFAVGAPMQLISVTPAVTTEGFSGGTIKATRLKDDATGKVYAASTNTISDYQSQMMSLYGDLDGPSSGRIMTTFKIVIMDYISQKNTTFLSPVLLTTVTAY